MRYFLTLILMLFLITPSFAGWDGKYYCFCPTSESCEYYERGSIKNMSQHHYGENHYIRVLLKDGRVRVFNYQKNLDRFDISFHYNMMFFLEDMDDTDNYDYVFSPKFKTTIIKSNTVSLIENFIINIDFCIKVHLKEGGYKLFNYKDDAEAMYVDFDRNAQKLMTERNYQYNWKVVDKIYDRARKYRTEYHVKTVPLKILYPSQF